MSQREWMRIGLFDSSKCDFMKPVGTKAKIKYNKGGRSVSSKFQVCSEAVDRMHSRFLAHDMYIAFRPYVKIEQMDRSVAKEWGFEWFYNYVSKKLRIHNEYTYNKDVMRSKEGRRFISYIMDKEFGRIYETFAEYDAKNGNSKNPFNNSEMKEFEQSKRRVRLLDGLKWATDVGSTPSPKDVEEKVKKYMQQNNLYNHQQYVYTIKLKNSLNEVWYYVGMTNSPVNRIPSHNVKEYRESGKIEFIDVVDIEICHNREHARSRERERYMEVIENFDTENVLGGQ
jgi:predicted GIY-YIG superfamily endonuclease